ADAFDVSAAWPEGREIVADAAALLHRQRRFAQMREDAAHIVRDLAHDEAVEERHLAPRPRSGDDAPGRQKAEIAHRRVKAIGPTLRLFFRRGRGGGDAPPGVLDRLVD